MAARMLLAGVGGGGGGGEGVWREEGLGSMGGSDTDRFYRISLVMEPTVSSQLIGRHAGRHHTLMLREFIATDGRNSRALDINMSPDRSKFAYYNYGR